MASWLDRAPKVHSEWSRAIEIDQKKALKLNFDFPGKCSIVVPGR